MWLFKTTTIPVIVGALGMTKKGTEKPINKIAGSPGLHETQKIAFYGTGHQPRRRVKIITQKRLQKT